jgi:hypothetical protein
MVSGGEEVDGGLVGCDAVWTSRLQARSLETLVSTKNSAQLCNPEDQH